MVADASPLKDASLSKDELGDWSREHLLSLLQEEIKTAKKSKRFPVVRGSLLRQDQYAAVWALAVEYPADVKVGSPVKLELRRPKTEVFKGEVLAQAEDEITCSLDEVTFQPGDLPGAVLTVDESGILEELSHRLEGKLPYEDHAIAVFSGTTNLVERDVPPEVNNGNDHQKAAVRRAMGADVTYLWGPPGTGKTTTVAAILRACLLREEPVLLTSNTHLAVDEALLDLRHALGDDPILNEAKVLRWGKAAKPELQADRRIMLDAVAEDRSSGSRLELAQLEERLVKLKSLDLKVASLHETERELDAAEKNLQEQQRSLASAGRQLQDAERNYGRALLAFQKWQWLSWWPQVKRLRATADVAREVAYAARKRKEETASTVARAEDALAVARAGQAAVVEPFRAVGVVSSEEYILELRRVEARIEETKRELRDLRHQLIQEALVVGVTLAATAMAADLYSKGWKVVVIDEVSMVTPPYVYFATSLASGRVVLAGDFMQLPPVVQAEAPGAKQALSKDIYRVAGIAELARQGDTEMRDAPPSVSHVVGDWGGSRPTLLCRAVRN